MKNGKGMAYLGVAAISVVAFAVMGPLGLIVLGVCLMAIGNTSK